MSVRTIAVVSCVAAAFIGVAAVALRAQSPGTGAAADSIFDELPAGSVPDAPKPPPAGKGLEVIEAVFGVGDTWLDVTDDLRPAVVNNRLMMRVCVAMVSRDPRSGFKKHLKLKYAVDGKVCSVEIPENSFCVIGDEPPLPESMRRGFHVIEAHVGAGTTWRDVTERARELATQPVMQVRISHLIPNERERDVVRDVAEVTYLRYAMNGRVYSAVVREGELLKLDTRNAVQPAVFVTP